MNRQNNILKEFINKDTKYKKYMDRKMIFIIGCGRSGTHWIGYILDGHQDIKVSIEKPKVFKLATTMALNPYMRPYLLPKLVKRYNSEFMKSSPQHYADKSHPNLWQAEALSNIYPNSFFIGIQRNPYATISSMLKHKGVQVWYSNWRKIPVPNDFLGINHQNKDKYDNYSIEEKSALRWIAHKNQLNRLKSILGERLHVLEYEELIKNTAQELKKIGKFLDLSTPISKPEIKFESLDKWREQLSESSIEKIKRILSICNKN